MPDGKRSKEQASSTMSIEDEKKSYSTRYPIDQESTETSTDSIQSVLRDIQKHHQRAGEAPPVTTEGTTNLALSEGPGAPQLRRQERRERQQIEPGAVRIRGHDHQTDRRHSVDNLNDAYSEEFRRTSIVKARVLSQQALQQELMESFQHGTLVVEASSVTQERERIHDGGSSFHDMDSESLRNSKTQQSNRWVCIGIAVCVVALVALVGGVVGGLLASRDSNPEAQLPPTPSSSSPSLFPTTLPTPDVPDELLELFSIVQIHPDYPFPHDTTSYAYEALEWVQDQRNRHPNLTQQEIIYKYAGACIALIFDVLDTFSLEAVTSAGWLTDRPVCEWGGMVCDFEQTSAATNSTTTNSTPNQVIVSFEIQNIPLLQGLLPPELALLSNSLTRFLCIDTMVYGTIPTELGLLTKLQILNLSNNELTGRVPSEIGLLTELRYLGLAENSLTGTLPMELSSIASLLEEISLSGNRLSRLLDSQFFDAMTNLQVLRGDSNSFGGSLPSEIGLMTKLRILSLFNSETGSSLPTEIGLLTDLEELDLSLNVHDGSLPSEMGHLVSLRVLYLDRNELTGTIPPQIFDQLFNLTVLDISLNGFSGTLPEALGLLPNLEELYIGRNNFVGSNPVCQDESTTAASDQTAVILAACSVLDCPCCTHCCEDFNVCHRSQISDP